MARKPKMLRVWFENFDLEVEITELITRIETLTKFELPDKKRDMVFSYAATKLGKTKEAYADAKNKGKPVSTSCRDFVSKLWHDGIDGNSRKYAEALKRPERERVPLRLGRIV